MDFYCELYTGLFKSVKMGYSFSNLTKIVNTSSPNKKLNKFIFLTLIIICEIVEDTAKKKKWNEKELTLARLQTSKKNIFFVSQIEI